VTGISARITREQAEARDGGMGADIEIREWRGSDAAAPAIFHKGPTGDKSSLIGQYQPSERISAEVLIEIDHRGEP
jgi:hypothetical protein